MITLYLVRHGETTYNAEGRIQGHCDAPLSKLGIRQASAIAGRLKSERFDSIYASDLKRAYITAQAIAEPHEMDVQQTPLLRESNLGILQGLTRAEIEEKYPAELYDWRRNPLKLRPPGAETLREVIDRCGRFLSEIKSRHEDGARIAVVGHGGSLCGLVVSALELDEMAYRRFHFSNASLSILETGNRSGLWLMNETCHLKALKTDEETDVAVG